LGPRFSRGLNCAKCKETRRLRDSRERGLADIAHRSALHTLLDTATNPLIAAEIGRRQRKHQADRAAGLCVTYGTTLYALKDRAKLKPGETLAVLGASGGTGLAAIEIGKIMGARVVACASSPEKLAFARAHGADETIDYAAEDLKDALRRVTGGQGADVIYDPVGGPYAEASLRSIAWEGRYLVVGFAAGEIPKVPFNLYLLKSANVLGVFWGAWTERDPEGHRANNAQLLAWAAEGKLSSHVHAVYPLADAAKANAVSKGRHFRGKLVLKVR
jgi:NADPH2:quinone reductase